MRLGPELTAKILSMVAEQAGQPALPVQEPSEKEFQADVVKVARRSGWLVYHTFDSRKCQRGFPDLVLLNPDRGLLVAELKVGRNELTPEQHDWLTAFRAAGIPAFEWRPKDWPEIIRTLTTNPEGDV